MRGHSIGMIGTLVATTAAMGYGPTPAGEYFEIPGNREFSGQMIVRPLQIHEFRELGVTANQANQRLAAARKLMNSFVIREHVLGTDQYIIHVPQGQTENTLSRALMATGNFKYAEPNWIVYPLDCPNDPRLSSQYQHNADIMQSCDAWDIETGDTNIVVAICDTGIRTTHEDLQLHRVEGYNAVDRQWENQGGQIIDINGHGTAVTGCPAANGDNGIGVSGVCWNVSHRMMRVSNDSGGGAWLSDLQHGASTAIEAGDRVANVSYSGVDNMSNLDTATYIKSLGGLLVWSAGNDGRNLTLGDRDADDIIVVGATDSSDSKAGFSAYGKFVDVTAPGVDVLTTSNSGDRDYGGASGTSFSAPLAAGTIALVWSANSQLTPDEVESFIKLGSDDLGVFGPDDTFGYGRLNNFGAVSQVSAKRKVIQRISVASGNIEGDKISSQPDMTFDGGTIVYQSDATNLIGADTNGVTDVFRYDVALDLVDRISVSSEGTQADAASSSPAISRNDGQYIAFESMATNLIPESSDTNGAYDVFMRDTLTGSTTRISRTSQGLPPNGASRYPSISADGSFIVFQSKASNIVSGDTNNADDIFLHDVVNGTTLRISKSWDGRGTNGGSFVPKISPDGSKIAYYSFASNIVQNDTNGTQDVFLYDVLTSTTRLLTKNYQTGWSANADSCCVSFSGDSKYVAFQSAASNLMSGDTNNKRDVFLYDIAAQTLQLMSVNDNGQQGNDDSLKSAMSYDGRFVAFESWAKNLISNDPNRLTDIYVVDRDADRNGIMDESCDDCRTIRLMSIRSNSLGSQQGGSSNPRLSADGGTLVYDSVASDIVDDDANGVRDVFMTIEIPEYSLAVEGLVVGQDATFTVSDGTPFASQFIAYSRFGMGELYIPFLDVTALLLRPELVDVVVTDEFGNASTSLTVPAIAQGKQVWIQAVEREARTNLVTMTVQ